MASGDIEGISLLTSSGYAVTSGFRAAYAPSALINFMSSGQLDMDGVGCNTYNGCFVNQNLRQEVAAVTWVANVTVFTIQDPLARQAEKPRQAMKARTAGKLTPGAIRSRTTLGSASISSTRYFTLLANPFSQSAGQKAG